MNMRRVSYINRVPCEYVSLKDDRKAISGEGAVLVVGLVVVVDQVIGVGQVQVGDLEAEILTKQKNYRVYYSLILFIYYLLYILCVVVQPPSTEHNAADGKRHARQAELAELQNLSFILLLQR